MKKYINILLIFTASLLINGCAKENMGDCFKTAGNVETQTRDVSGFSRIKLEDKIELYVTQSNYYEVKVETGRDLQSNIKTEVQDSVLTIKNINKCNFIRDPNATLKVYVTMPYLRMIRNGGVGTIYFQNEFTGDTLDIRIGNSGDVHANVNFNYISTSTHGNGDLYLTGKVNYSSHYTNGTNYLHMEDLFIKDKIILNSYTIGDCYLNAPENGVMEVEIWESGSIYYKGNPASIAIKQEGKGKLIKE